MKLFSKKSIIFYSVLGAIVGFMIIPWIRSLLDYSAIVEILITTAIIIPMYAVLTRLMKNFLN
jgi:xanthosine utilization system XapX-like protein|tara:strand:+ start:221 stop:409 length:189 start_codon:yes stop_codon:yes gene_type:complete